MPHDHQKKVAKFYWATPELVQLSIDTALAAKKDWEAVPINDKIQMFLKVADQMADQYRADLNATTMLGQAKTIIQAEIDSACELIDFFRLLSLKILLPPSSLLFRFNCFFAKELHSYQPISEDPSTTLNLLRYRALEGFIASVTPFNFTAIAGNLAYTPCVMGNVSVWKPSDTAILSNYLIYKIFRDAGFPDGVVNVVPADGPVFGKTVTAHPDLASVNFTGSVPTFQWLWKAVGENLQNYAGFPKLIGECGGKNYHFVHPTAEVETVVASTIRSAFEYSGQKCSACSRVYAPESLWPQIKEGLVEIQKGLKIGAATDADSFTSAVIDKKSFDRRVNFYLVQCINSIDIVSQGVRLHQARKELSQLLDRGRRWFRRQRGLLHRADRGADQHPRGQDLPGGDLRTRGHRVRVQGRGGEGDDAEHHQAQPLQSHWRSLLSRPGLKI